MDLSEILNPSPDNEADPNYTQSRHASAAGSSNDGHTLSQPSSNLARPKRGYAPILSASALSTADANTNSQSSATLNNGPGSSAAGPSSRPWNPDDNPRISRPLSTANPPIQAVRMVSETGASRLFPRKEWLDTFGERAALPNWKHARPHTNDSVRHLAFPCHDEDTSKLPEEYPTSAKTFDNLYAASCKRCKQKPWTTAFPTDDFETTTWGPGTG